jgi:hypothetical protein
VDRHRCGPEALSERAVDSWRDAALHLLQIGQLPLVPLEARRALWRRGGDDQALAQHLYELCGGDT